jgi:uncharacterized RDD family membrane protein YckC
MAETEWYYGKGGQKIGPVTQGDLQQLILTGQLSEHDYVWRAGYQNWVKANQVIELQQMFAGGGAMPGSVGGSAINVDFDLGGDLGKFGQLAKKGSAVSFGASDDYAGFWKRFAAAILDGLILTIPQIIINMIGVAFGAMVGAGGGSPEEQQVAAALASVFITLPLGLILYIGYFAGMESSSLQATLGKLALGIKVTDLDGDRVTFLRATGRTLGKIVSQMICFIGYIMAGFTERKQALHDMMASCLVVNK